MYYILYIYLLLFVLLWLLLPFSFYSREVPRQNMGMDNTGNEMRDLAIYATGGSRLLCINFTRNTAKSAARYLIHTAGGSVATDGL